MANLRQLETVCQVADSQSAALSVGILSEGCPRVHRKKLPDEMEGFEIALAIAL